MVNVALHKGAVSHPYNIGYVQLALWSINERLGGKSGQDLPLPSLEYLDDIVAIMESEAEDRKKILKDM